MNVSSRANRLKNSFLNFAHEPVDSWETDAQLTDGEKYLERLKSTDREHLRVSRNLARCHGHSHRARHVHALAQEDRVHLLCKKIISIFCTFYPSPCLYRPQELKWQCRAVGIVSKYTWLTHLCAPLEAGHATWVRNPTNTQAKLRIVQEVPCRISRLPYLEHFLRSRAIAEVHQVDADVAEILVVRIFN